MSSKTMCPMCEKRCGLPWILVVTVVMVLTPGIRATGNLENFTARQSATMNPSTGNMAPTALEVLLSYQPPSETRETNGLEDRINWSKGEAGVKKSQSPNQHEQMPFVSELQHGPNTAGIILEAITNPRSLLINISTPTPKNCTEDPLYTGSRVSCDDAGTSDKTPGRHRDQMSQRPVKSHSLVSSKIISERTTIYPFIDATKALDYLSNYDTRPRPKRWPLRILLTEAEQQDMERRKKLVEYSTGAGEKSVGSALAGILGTLTELLLKSFSYKKRSKREAALESKQTPSVAASLSDSGGEVFPTDLGVDPIQNPALTLNHSEPLNGIHETRNNKRVIKFSRDKKILRRDRKRSKGSRGAADTNCDEMRKNVSLISSVEERHPTKHVNNDGVEHSNLNARNSSAKPSQEASVSRCDGYKKKKKRKRKNGFNKSPGDSSTAAPKEPSTTALKTSAKKTALQESSGTSSPVNVASFSRLPLGKNFTAEAQNTEIVPDNRTTSGNTTWIILESDPLKKNSSLTNFSPDMNRMSTEFGSTKSDVTEVWPHEGEHHVSTPTSPTNFLTGEDTGKTKTTSTSSRPALKWRDHLRRQRQRSSLDTVGVDTTTTAQTHFKTKFETPVTRPLPSTNEPTFTSFTTEYKSAYDFLSAQQGLRRDTPNNARKEAEAFNLRLAANLCKVFGKRYVPTPIGGKCE